tara:strand:+ start:4549 stop:4947 length:399 start_codon:yes stop_codon:yes gene_type:complete
MKITKEQLKQIIKEELEIVLQESKAYTSSDAKEAIEAGKIKPGDAFKVLVRNFNLKTQKTYQVERDAVYMGNKSTGEIPKGINPRTIVYYRKSDGDISSQDYRAFGSIAKLDQKLRNDPDQPYTLDDLDKAP